MSEDRWWEQAQIDARPAPAATPPAQGDNWWEAAEYDPENLPDAMPEYDHEGNILRVNAFAEPGVGIPVVPKSIAIQGGVPRYDMAFDPANDPGFLERIVETGANAWQGVQRGATQMISGPLASLGDFVERTVQSPLRQTMEAAAIADPSRAAAVREGFADPLGARGVRDEALGVQREVAADRAAALEAAGGRPELAEILADPVRAIEYYGPMIAESVPAMAGTVATARLAGPAAGSAVMGGLTGTGQYAESINQGVDPGAAAQQAVIAALAESAGEIPGLTGIMTPGRRAAGVALEGVGEAATQLGQGAAQDYTTGEQTPIAEQVRQALDAAVAGAGAAAPFAAAGAAADFVGPPRTPAPTVDQVAAQQVAEAMAAQQARDAATPATPAPVETVAPAAPPAPVQRGAADAGAVIDQRLAELEQRAGSALSRDEFAALGRRDAEIRELLRREEELQRSGTIRRDPGQAPDREALAAEQAQIRAQQEASRAAQGYADQLRSLQSRLERIDRDEDLVALANELSPPVDTSVPAGVQSARQQSAGVSGETRGEQVEEVQQAQGQPAEAGPAPGRAREEEAVEAQVAAATPPTPPQSASPLAPRIPPAPAVPSDLTLEQARAEYEAAQTDAQRATAAARIAAVRARDSAVGQAPRDQEPSRNQDGPTGPDASGQGAAGTRDVGSRPGFLLARGQAAYTDTDDADIRGALGTAARGISLHRSPRDLAPEDIERLGVAPDATDVEGLYDPDTGRVHLFEENFDPAMPRAARKVWVAAHERAGHAGLRGMFATEAGDNAAGRVALVTQLDRARNNPTVSAIVESMSAQRPERGPLLVEEAIAELAAAVRTGDYGHIQERYGVEVPAAQRKTVEGYIRRLVESIKRAFGRAGEAFSDADVYRLIEDAYSYAKTGDVRGTSSRAERAPASRFQNNGSGESAASIEAINRSRDEKALGRARVLIERNGTVRPLLGVDAVDAVARDGQIIVQRNIGRDEWTILSHGRDVTTELARGRINASMWALSEAAEDSLIASRTSSALLRNLTPSEQRKVTDKVAAKIVAQLTKLPPANEMAAVAYAGRAKRGWYRQSAEAISAVFGPDAPRFAALLAAMSPQTSVESNLRNALNTWANWEAAGRPTDREAIIDIMGDSVEGSRGRASVLGAWINNSVEALTTEDTSTLMLSGPKVNSFMRNLLGDVEEVTNDAWMANWALVDQTMFKGGKLKSGKDPGKGAGYLAMNVRVREAARRLTKLTGETWSPAEVQETVWSWAKTLTELADSATEIRNARELVEDRAITDELLQSTPDFGTLFTDPAYARILEEAGYGEQVKRIRASRNAAREAREEPASRGQAEPFAPEAQRRFELRSAARIDALRKARLDVERGEAAVTEPEEDVPFSRRQTVKMYGEDQGADLEGLPVRVRVGDRGVVEFHGYAPAQEIAAKYAARHGNQMPRRYVQVDEARAKRIADAYERLEHQPDDPQVKRAFRAMIDETIEQYRDMLKTGLQVEFITGDDPYTNGPRDAILDVVENNHLWVYPTRSGFGTQEEFDPAGNPLLEETEFEISGQRALANDIFRAVHDYFGHVANGIGFRADGEENAWREHAAMYSPLARRAMTTETRGQNSWLNYGPNGESNRTAKAEDTIFADQKTGLLPEWVSEEGRTDEGLVASRGWSAKRRQPDAVSVDAYHYSITPDLTELDPRRAGSGSAGRERRRFGMDVFGRQGGTAARVAFYVREPGQPIPEAEDVVTGEHLYRTRLDNLYDGVNDPRGLVEDAAGNADAMEEAISEAGYDGFLAPPVPGIDVPTAIVFDIGNKRIPVEPVEMAAASIRTPQQARAERQQLLGQLATAGYPQQGQPIQIPAGTGPLARLSDAADALRVRLQDKMLPLLRTQEVTGARNAPGQTSLGLPDAQNAYRLETLMHGAVRDIVEGGEKRYTIPIQARLKNAGLSVPSFEGYLLARVAPEVNAHVAKINKAMPDGGAGITTAEARAVLAGTGPNPFTGKPMTARELQVAAAVAQFVDGLRNETLQNMIDAGQITPKLANELRNRYPNYVPLRGKAVPDWMEETPTGTGRGLSGKRASIKNRTGRGAGNLPQNILGELVGDFQRSAIAKSKAKVNQAFLRFALENPMPELYTVEPVDLEWKYSKATGEAYLGVRNTADDLDRAILVMHEGDPVRIRFEDKALRDAMLNMGPDDMRGVVNILGAINRWRSKVLTQYNPGFAPVNVTRDAIFGMSAVTAEHGPKIAAQAAAGYMPAMRAMYRQTRDNRPGDSTKPVGQRSWDDWAREASEVGMKTGLTRADDVKDLQRRMSVGATTLMQLAAEGKPWSLARESVTRALRPVVETISNVNDATENALRLSTYVALRKSGMSAERAAEYAKNMTINFNRKGQWGPALNAVYLFYNASIQGTHAVTRVLRNPYVLGSLTALGALQGLLVRQMMDDEDDDGVTAWDTVPDYVKRTSFVIPLGSLTGNQRDYYALPMPYGFNIFPYTGGRVSQWMKHGRRDTDPSFAADVFKSLTESFSPVQLNGDYGSLYGDQLGFAMQLASNRDDQGRPIAADNAFEQYDVPKALQGRAATPHIYERISQLMAKIGGGNLQKRIPPVGYLDVAPEQLEAVVNYMGGGLLSMVNKSMRWAENYDAKTFERPMDMVAATPIASRFVNTGNEARAIADRYYGERGQLARKIDVLQDDLMGLDDDQLAARIRQAANEDRTMTGIDVERYKRATKTGKAVGDVKRTEAGTVKLAYEATSAPKAMRNAEKVVKALGKQINRLRDEDITVQQVVDIGTGNQLTMEQIGLPATYKGDVAAPRRIRTRVIAEIQKIRAEAQKQALRQINFVRRNELTPDEFSATYEVEDDE